jgi:hypothetical protein
MVINREEMKMKATNFVVEDEAVRSSADRISNETRRMRREFNGTTQHFQLDPRVVVELSQRGHLCWCNDDLKGHLRYLEQIGYTYVTNREAYGDRTDMEPEARATVRYGVADDKNTPQDTYLMIQPWEFYEEDMKQLDLQNSAVDKKIVSEGKEVEKSYDHRVTLTHN